MQHPWLRRHAKLTAKEGAAAAAAHAATGRAAPPADALDATAASDALGMSQTVVIPTRPAPPRPAAAAPPHPAHLHHAASLSNLQNPFAAQGEASDASLRSGGMPLPRVGSSVFGEHSASRTSSVGGHLPVRSVVVETTTERTGSRNFVTSFVVKKPERRVSATASPADGVAAPGTPAQAAPGGLRQSRMFGSEVWGNGSGSPSSSRASTHHHHQIPIDLL